MNLRYIYYKVLRLCHFISELEFKRKIAYYSTAYKVVSRSKLFNKNWYLSEYPQVKESGMDSITHYINDGFRDGLLPSKDFDSKKIFILPYPVSYYGFHNSKAKKNAFVEHAEENRVENFKKEQRKILLLTHSLSLTGAPRALFNLAKVLQKKGLEPVVLSPSFGDLEKELENNGIEFYIEPILLMRLLFQDETIKAFFQSFSIIVFNTLPSLRYAPFITSENKKLAWIHEARLAFEREAAMVDVHKLFENIDEVYSVGEYSKSYTDKYIEKSKSNILLYAIKEFENSKHIMQKDKQFSFAIFGHCSERKGHDVFIKAVQKLPKEVKEACVFKIIGKIDERKFSQNIKRVAQEEGIICTGQLSYIDTLSEMSRIDCVVCPSTDDPMPMVCTEAFMLQKTVLVSTQTGTAYFIKHGDNGYVFDVEEDILCKLLVDVYTHRSKLELIGKEARKIYLQNFTDETFEREIEKIFLH